MLTIDQIVDRLKIIRFSKNNEWHLFALVEGRLYLSRGPHGEHDLFVSGPVDSFGPIPPMSALEYRSDAIDLQAGHTFSALRVETTPDFEGTRILGHIAYEMAARLELSSSLSNAELLSGVRWILSLLGSPLGVLSPEKQHGLFGECLLLHKLVGIALQRGFPIQEVILRWWGPNGGAKDFASVGCFIEVKTTSGNSRRHHIPSIDQLEAASADGKGYLFSVGVKSDPTIPRKLPTYVADVINQLVRADGTPDTGTRDLMWEKLAAIGYRTNDEPRYLTAPGLAVNNGLPPKLFRVEDLDRIRLNSFKNDILPTMVTGVSYDLELLATPLTPADEESVLNEFLRMPLIT